MWTTNIGRFSTTLPALISDIELNIMHKVVLGIDRIDDRGFICLYSFSHFFKGEWILNPLYSLILIETFLF